MTDSFSEFTGAPARRVRVTSPRPSRLGQTLREARQDSRLGLEDLTELTGIRLGYLEALEAGRFAELPGDAHGKSFVRRYAQAVGLDPTRVLVLYKQERTLEAADPVERLRGLELPAAEGALTVPPQFGRFVRLCASLLLVAAASWLALRAFDGALVPGGFAPAQADVDPNTATGVGARAAPHRTTTPAPAMILLSLQTTPPGAEVSIDGYHFGQSPIVDAPVRAGNRTIKVERSGYGTFERTLDLSRGHHLNVTLSPQGAEKAVVTSSTPAALVRTGTTPTPAAQQVVVSVTAEAWLEVYRGSARAGERLVYETAQPGETYSFTTPVYVFSGNAGGVSVAQGDAPVQPLGAPGAVIGQAYRQP